MAEKQHSTPIAEAEWDLAQAAFYIKSHDEAAADAARARQRTGRPGVKQTEGRALWDWFKNEPGFEDAFARLWAAICDGRQTLYGVKRRGQPAVAIPDAQARGLEVADGPYGLSLYHRGQAAQASAWRERNDGLLIRGLYNPNDLPVEPYAWRLRLDRQAVIDGFPEEDEGEATIAHRPPKKKQAIERAFRNRFPNGWPKEEGHTLESIVADVLEEIKRSKLGVPSEDYTRKVLRNYRKKTRR